MIAANIHGGADMRRVTVVEYPSVAVSVGKKLTNDSPRSCEQVMIAKSGTLGSFSAIINPENAESVA